LPVKDLDGNAADAELDLALSTRHAVTMPTER
jgi:hypothetical protein